MIKAKICGITNYNDALASVEAGCDALGFVFYKKSPRYIDPLKARQIITKFPEKIIKIGVFANAREKRIRDIARLCKLDMLQFHGDESPKFCLKFKDYKVIKAFRVGNGISLSDICKYKPFAYLFDTFVPSKLGGTGKQFDWKLIRHINDLSRPVFLSGGLTAKNVKQAIKTVNPDWVDVSTHVEESPGKKDHSKVKEFLKQAKDP